VLVIVQLVIAAAVIGFFGDKDEDKGSVLDWTGHNLRLYCGTDDNDWSKNSSSRVLCNPRIWSDGSEI
jgi:hypothetical protein